MNLTVVIPTKDMAPHLPTLWETLVSSGLVEHAAEIVIVNDGSTDATREILDGIATSEKPGVQKLKPVHLEKNVGRFHARHLGAKAAKSENILFLDTRLQIPRGFAEALEKASVHHRSIVGTVDIDITRNVFCLYWDRSHRFIFRRHYDAASNPIVLNTENFDDYLKGTTVFMCPRQSFIDACEEFADSDLLSDDTFLMKRMVETCPITVHPDVRVGWVPRETFTEFLWRIWDRGPGFAEYHVIERRSVFFYATFAGLVVVSGVGVAIVVAPPVGLAGAAIGVGVVAASTALFAKSPSEFVRMMPLHVATAAMFGAAAVRGTAVNLLRIARKRGAPSIPAGAE